MHLICAKHGANSYAQIISVNPHNPMRDVLLPSTFLLKKERLSKVERTCNVQVFMTVRLVFGCCIILHF